MPAPLDITNQRFNRLTALRVVARDGQGVKWLCQCDCGQTHIAHTKSLRSGNTRSCGCLNREIIGQQLLRHGHSRRGRGPSKTFTAWANMLQRGGNPNLRQAADYIGRGITVCDRWHTFENFLSDMGEAPPGLTLDRRDNDRGYCPDNCRWTDRHTQARNKRRQGPQKLTPQEVITIRKDARLQQEIAQAYGISQTNVSAIKRRKTWRHL